MPVTVRCEACGHTYGAPDSFAGKKVRCRHCGQIVAIPAALKPPPPMIIKPAPAAQSPVAPPPSIAPVKAPAPTSSTPPPTAASPGGLSARPRDVPQSPPIEEEIELQADDILEDDDDNDSVIVESLPLRPVLPGNSRYDFPGSKLLDSLTPWVLVVGGITWITMQSVSTGTVNYPNIGWLRATVYLLLYSLLVFPATLGAVSIGVRMARFGLPPFGAWRVYASFFPAVVLSVVLWLVTDLRASFITGFCVGFPLSLGALWLLLRLLPYQAKVLAWAAGGFLLGGALAIGLLLAINLALKPELKSSTPAFEQSPLGAGFAWEYIAPPNKPKAKRSATTEEVPATMPTYNDAASTQPTTQPSTMPTTQPTTEPTTAPSGFMQWLRRTISD